jgi:hypothetical protein
VARTRPLSPRTSTHAARKRERLMPRGVLRREGCVLVRKRQYTTVRSRPTLSLPYESFQLTTLQYGSVSKGASTMKPSDAWHSRNRREQFHGFHFRRTAWLHAASNLLDHAPSTSTSPIIPPATGPTIPTLPLPVSLLDRIGPESCRSSLGPVPAICHLVQSSASIPIIISRRNVGSIPTHTFHVKVGIAPSNTFIPRRQP